MEVDLKKLIKCNCFTTVLLMQARMSQRRKQLLPTICPAYVYKRWAGKIKKDGRNRERVRRTGGGTDS